MNGHMAYALRSGLVALESIGSDGENPKVSAVSRFDDAIWDFSNEDENPARADRKIRWSFQTPQGTLFTDPQFQSLLIGFKQFIYALRWHPIDSAPFGVTALCAMFRARETIRRPSAGISHADPSIQRRPASPL